jgi:hypothetical protein
MLNLIWLATRDKWGRQLLNLVSNERRTVEANGLALLLIAAVGLVLMFAQLKLFSIDTSLKRIIELLEREARGRSGGNP